MAPNYIKSLVKQINFEKRQNNIEKAKELYYQTYQQALVNSSIDTLTYILMQYSRFLAFKCEEPSRALDILNQALGKIGKQANKTFYLSYVNFLKHMEMGGPNSSVSDIFVKVCSLFEKALDEEGAALSLPERRDIAKFYLEYVSENSNGIS
mmetsp:Transcript_14215/g.13778  ORF Transcript_14215/g.13778 Transcript_14215/m.13778 type:complete len:152 (+) Transcript_14215:945-1400(+)